MTPSNFCFLPTVGSTFSNFTNFQFIAINMHIDFVIFRNVLPALAGEHISHFYRLSQLRKIHANHNRSHFLRFGVPLEASWVNFGPSSGQLGAKLGQRGANLDQHEPNLGQLEPTYCRLGADLVSTWAILGPTWVRKTWKIIVFHWFF